MKHTIRIAVLMLGLVGMYASAAVQGPTPDGGMIPTHPKVATVQGPAPDGGMIPTHPKAATSK
jgi:hypothetical protein